MRRCLRKVAKLPKWQTATEVIFFDCHEVIEKL